MCEEFSSYGPVGSKLSIDFLTYSYTNGEVKIKKNRPGYREQGNISLSVEIVLNMFNDLVENR